MIIDKSNGRLSEIRNFARQQNLEADFNEIYYQLEKYSEKGHDVILYREYNPLSLSFSLSFAGEVIVEGKILYHGSFKDAVLPPFSVSMKTRKKAGWVIET
jgi:hypothetical protein